MTTTRAHRAPSLTASLVATVLILAACGGGDDTPDVAATSEQPSEAPDAQDGGEPTTDIEVTAPPAEQEPDPTSAPTTTSTTTTSTTTTTTLPPRLGATPDDPAPVGDSAADLVGYDTDGTLVDTHVVGLVRVGAAPDQNPDGDCFVLLGTSTATTTTGLATDFRHLPRLELRVGDATTPYAARECDLSAVTAAGWSDVQMAEMTAGTSYSFRQPFVVPAGAEPSLIQVAVESSPLVTYYEPTLLDAVPDAPERAIGEFTATALSAVGPDRPTVEVVHGDAVWEVSIFGAATSPRSDRSINDPGECWNVVGSMKGVESVGAIVNAFAQPDVALLVDGIIIDQAIGECDTGALEAGGYDSALYAGVAVDNTYAFSTSFVIPGAATPTAIVVGEPATAGTWWTFEAPRLEVLPEAPPRERMNPSLDLVAAGQSDYFTVTAVGDVEWTGTVFGLIELENNAVDARCVAVVGEMRADTSDAFPPSVSLIVDGALYGEAISIASCDAEALTAAGYEPARSVRSAGETVRFYASIFLPSDIGEIAGIAVGNPASADNVVYVEPTLIDQAP